MYLSKSVDEYIDIHVERRKELKLLRSILLKTELVEEVKWGAPCYTWNGKNVIGLGAFKSYVGLWFHQGVFLADDHQVLVNANEEKTKGQRQWRFNSIEEMDTLLIQSYIFEAIENQKEGKEIKAEPKKLIMPDELHQACKSDKNLKLAFDALTPGRQKEYAEYIGSAKQDATRISRLRKTVPMILEGVGLHDKYRS